MRLAPTSIINNTDMKAHKKSLVKIYELNKIRKRRMAKYHARKIMREYKEFGLDSIWLASLKAFVSIKYVGIKPHLRKYISTYSIRFFKTNNVDN